MLLNKYLDFNYFESEYYKITLYNNIYSDKFYIYYDDVNIIIQRIDKNTGWGQELKLIIRNKILNNELSFTVGNSINNIKKIEINSLLNKYFFNKTVINYSDYELNHFENNNFKLFYISELYNDIFKIDYNEENSLITIKRLDKNDGWGQELKLKYINKKTNKIKLINIGKSDKNILFKIIDFDKIEYKELYNYYESDLYIITIIDNLYSDIFLINFYEDNNTVQIKRIDKNTGWGELLKINIYNKNQNKNYIIYIGDSLINEIYKKVDLNNKKYYVALTTIPSRIKLLSFSENIKSFIDKQTYPIEQLFITIAKKYKRFSENISDKIINSLKNIPKVTLIILENDLGPASKYMGPLEKYYNILENNLLIIIDDDRIYNENLVKNFAIASNSYPSINFMSGKWIDYFSKNYKYMDHNKLEIEIFKEKNDNLFPFGSSLGGFFGFAINVINLEKFIEYNKIILNRIEKSFFHDEGIILGYLKYKEENILYLKHYGCNYIENELVDALCDSGLCDRRKVEQEILNITNLETLL